MGSSIFTTTQSGSGSLIVPEPGSVVNTNCVGVGTACPKTDPMTGIMKLGVLGSLLGMAMLPLN